MLSLLKRDELHERAIVRCLIEFGLKDWDGNIRVADYLIEEFVDQQLIEDASLVPVMELYKNGTRKDLSPLKKIFCTTKTRQMSASVVSLLEFPYELSPNWKEHFEGKIFTTGGPLSGRRSLQR